MPKLPEKELRRPDARGVPVVLGDGGEWLFPKPSFGLVPKRGEDGTLVFDDKRRCSFGDAYDALLDAFVEAEDGVSECTALLNLAADLLQRNYALESEHLTELLPRWFDDEANTEMWKAVADIALGRGPKPIPVG